MKIILSVFVAWITVVSAHAGEPDGASLRIIRNEYGFKMLQLEIAHDTVEQETRDFKNDISHEAALRMALESFLKEDRDPESPLAIAGSPQRLRRLLDHSSSVVHLLRSDESPEGYTSDATTRAWIFQLSIPRLSDHVYWAVIDRQGRSLPFNFGVN